MSQFDDETRLRALSSDQFTGRVNSAWNIASNPNGGYLMALAAAALKQRVPQHPDPLSITVHYLRPGSGDEDCHIETEVVRSGASLSTVRARFVQQDKARLEVLASMGSLDSASAPKLTLAAPELPAPEHCIGRSGEAQGVFLPIMQRLDIRMHPDEAIAGRSKRAQISGWIRFLDGREPDPLALLLFADAFPPSVFSLLGLIGWVPTIELSVQVRRRPAPGWVRARFQTLDLADGRMIEDGALWDSEGHLVAQSRQLAMLRTPA